MSTTAITLETVRVRGADCHVYCGGSGSPLLLVHGGWTGARLHFRDVWSTLAERHRVIAPDLPGLGAIDQPALPSVGAYAEWLVALLDALGVERAWCVGNSFGGSVVWTLASRHPERCAGVVLVNGIPMPKTPWVLRALGKTRAARALMCAILARTSYGAAAVTRAFANASRVPQELTRVMAVEWPVLVPRFADLLIAGDGAVQPNAKTLLLFGAADRGMGTKREDAKRLHARIPGSSLHLIEGAGHFPQLEASASFIEALERFVSSAGEVGAVGDDNTARQS